MIDLAIITSTPHLADLATGGSIDMALTHLVLNNPAYAAHYRARAAAGVHVILDNSAFELEDTTGAGLGAEPVLKAAALVGASTVICQDVLFDCAATTTSTKRFLAHAADLAESGTYRYMAVPQGTTEGEWMASYRDLAALPGIEVIGLSKLSVPAAFGAPVAEARLACVQALRSAGACLPLHLLGGDRSLLWELTEHHQRGNAQPDGPVVSNDSSFAYWYPACDIGLDPGTLRAARSAQTKPNLDDHQLTPAQLAVAHGVVEQLRTAAGLPR